MSQWIVISNYLTSIFMLTGHPGINFAFLKAICYSRLSFTSTLILIITLNDVNMEHMF